MKALGKDIWDFYQNGWPEGCYRDTGWAYMATGDYYGCPSLESDKLYDLDDFGNILFKENPHYEDGLNFEETFLDWKNSNRLKPINTFDEWFSEFFPDLSEMKIQSYLERNLRRAWNAAINSVGGNK